MVRERCNRNRNAGAELIFFFLKDSSTILRIRFVSIVSENESDDNSYVAYDRGSQNRRFAKSGPKSSRFAKKGSSKQKVWEPLVGYSHLLLLPTLHSTSKLKNILSLQICLGQLKRFYFLK